MNNKATSEDKLPWTASCRDEAGESGAWIQHEGLTSTCSGKKLRVKTLPGALEADLIAHWCQHPVCLDAKSKLPQPPHPWQLHILIPLGFITQITFKNRSWSYRWFAAPICQCAKKTKQTKKTHNNPACLSAPWTDLASGHCSQALWGNMNGISSRLLPWCWLIYWTSAHWLQTALHTFWLPY